MTHDRYEWGDGGEWHEIEQELARELARECYERIKDEAARRVSERRQHLFLVDVNDEITRLIESEAK